ncbi:MAG: DUF1499 domain-containing protein [Pseudomonadota bacterium]
MTVWWSRAILIFAVLAAAALPIGALGSRFGVWDFRMGLLVLLAGVLIAAVVFLGGGVGWFVANSRKLAGDRSAISLGLVVSALILGVMALPFYSAVSVPPIHNISTDVDDPPAFDTLAAARGPDDNPLSYDASKLAPAQQQAYPWVQPLTLAQPPAAAVAAAADALDEMGLEVVNRDPANGLVEATATTFWFGFKDDLVVRVRPEGTGSRVDVRSVSRVGQSDLGANARRIGQLLDLLQSG